MRFSQMAFVLAMTSMASSGATFVISETDFDTTTGLNGGNPGGQLTSVANPFGTGNVGSIDLGGGGQWGEVRATPDQNISLPAETVVGTDTFVATMDVYIDTATTTFIAGQTNDRVNLILRFNDGVDDAQRVNRASNNAWETLPANQWTTISVNVAGNVIPDIDGGGDAITHVLPILSFRDQNDDAAAGTAVYIDNFSLSVTGVPEPSAGILGMLGGFLLLRRRR